MGEISSRPMQDYVGSRQKVNLIECVGQRTDDHNILARPFKNVSDKDCGPTISEKSEHIHLNASYFNETDSEKLLY